MIDVNVGKSFIRPDLPSDRSGSQKLLFASLRGVPSEKNPNDGLPVEAGLARGTTNIPSAKIAAIAQGHLALISSPARHVV